jgi:hypothetical protein
VNQLCQTTLKVLIKISVTNIARSFAPVHPQSSLEGCRFHRNFFDFARTSLSLSSHLSGSVEAGLEPLSQFSQSF